MSTNAEWVPDRFVVEVTLPSGRKWRFSLKEEFVDLAQLPLDQVAEALREALQHTEGVAAFERGRVLAV